MIKGEGKLPPRTHTLRKPPFSRDTPIVTSEPFTGKEKAMQPENIYVKSLGFSKRRLGAR